ncbi:unnamed protein product [Boreogadus saida]
MLRSKWEALIGPLKVPCGPVARYPPPVLAPGPVPPPPVPEPLRTTPLPPRASGLGSYRRRGLNPRPPTPHRS